MQIVAGPRCPSRLSNHNPIKSANVTTMSETHPVSAVIAAMDKFLIRDSLLRLMTGSRVSEFYHKQIVNATL